MNTEIDRVRLLTERTQGRRHQQEDQAFSSTSDPSAVWFGVADGHGGGVDNRAGDICAQFFSEILTHHYPSADFRTAETVTDFVLTTFRACQTLVSGEEFMGSGAAFTLCILDWELGKMFTFQLGDCPIIVVNWEGKVETHFGHNLDISQDARQEITDRGGKLAKLQGTQYGFDPANSSYGLNMSRAFGDMLMDKVLGREPEIRIFDLEKIEGGCIGSDGIWSGERKDQEVVNMIRDSLFEETVQSKSGSWEPILPYLASPTEDGRPLTPERVDEVLGDNTTLVRFRIVRDVVNGKP